MLSCHALRRLMIAESGQVLSLHGSAPDADIAWDPFCIVEYMGRAMCGADAWPG